MNQNKAFKFSKPSCRPEKRTGLLNLLQVWHATIPFAWHWVVHRYEYALCLGYETHKQFTKTFLSLSLEAANKSFMDKL